MERELPDIQELLASGPVLRCSLKLFHTSREWKRVFIIRHDNCQIGYVNYRNGVLYNWHSYKTMMLRLPIDGTDEVMIRLIHWLKTGQELEGYDALVVEVTETCRLDKEEKLRLRETLPVKQRKSIRGKDPRFMLYERMR